MHPSTLLRVRF